MTDLIPDPAEPHRRAIDPATGLDAFKHEAETPMREHGECCEPTPDDLPGEPVEPGHWLTTNQLNQLGEGPADD